jgi:hypothetical protein
VGSKIRQLRRSQHRMGKKGNVIMQEFTYLPDLPLTNTNDDPLRDADGGQATLTDEDFLLGRLADPAFGQGFEPLVAARMVRDTKKAIHAQLETAKERGTWRIEDTPARALARAILKPTGGYDSRYQHLLVDHIERAEKMKQVEEKKDEAKPNGAEAKALPETAQA